MRNMVQLLDCTLREAPVNGLLFGDHYIRKFIEGIQKTNVDTIEIGFLKNERHRIGSTIFQHVEEIRPYIIPGSKTRYVALIDYGRYDIENLSDYDGSSIHGIRICFKKGEQDNAIALASQIKNKGYDVYIQHVDTLGYSKAEINEIIDKVNKLKPYAYSIVDTFGAMYSDEVIKMYSLVDSCLDKDICLGFHAHNNLLLANSNAQGFIDGLSGKRQIMVDASVHGCGRGAGNAHTELLMEYMNRKYQAGYDIDCIMDLMDECVDVLKNKASWGYNIPYMIAGMYKTHVFNVDYLLSRHNIKFRDLREIIEQLDDHERRIYDYPALERRYVEHFSHHVDDYDARKRLQNEIADRDILLLAPGRSIYEYKVTIEDFINETKPYIIDVNNIIDEYYADSVFFCSPRRYEEAKKRVDNLDILITSNIDVVNTEKYHVFDYYSLLKFGWANIDNACILLLRLLLQCGVRKIYMAGFDGYQSESFYKKDIEKSLSIKDIERLNREIKEMLADLLQEYWEDSPQICFLTPSLYEEVEELDRK